METPKCIGFIMDGNRRYAVENGLSPLSGHSLGVEVFFNVVEYVRTAKIPHAVFYAFSTENWQRTKPEVEHLLQLFLSLLTRVSNQFVRVRIIGRRQDFSEELQSLIGEVEEKTKQYTETIIWIALSYGGRAEIVEAVNRAIERGEAVGEDCFAALLPSAGLLDPDIIVRTSGEQRLSNFLPWQSVYSELYFIPKHWPALTKDDFDAILAEYGKRQRRRGA